MWLIGLYNFLTHLKDTYEIKTVITDILHSEMVQIYFLIFGIFDVLRILEALFFYNFFLKWVKNEENFESSIIFEAQKYYFVF